MKSLVQKIFLVLTTLSAWFGVSLFTFLEAAKVKNIPLSFLNTFSYFTVQSNLFVAILCTLFLIKKFPKTRVTRVLEFGSVVNITITAVIYYVLLRQFKSEGLDSLANILQHYITPILYLGYSLFFRQKYVQSMTTPFLWLIYPICYIAYTFIRGGLTGYYPYFFINPVEIGWEHVLKNSFFMTLFIIAVSLVFHMVNNWLVKKLHAIPKH